MSSPNDVRCVHQFFFRAWFAISAKFRPNYRFAWLHKQNPLAKCILPIWSIAGKTIAENWLNQEDLTCKVVFTLLFGKEFFLKKISEGEGEDGEIE